MPKLIFLKQCWVAVAPSRSSVPDSSSGSTSRLKYTFQLIVNSLEFSSILANETTWYLVIQRQLQWIMTCKNTEMQVTYKIAENGELTICSSYLCRWCFLIVFSSSSYILQSKPSFPSYISVRVVYFTLVNETYSLTSVLNLLFWGNELGKDTSVLFYSLLRENDCW